MYDVLYLYIFRESEGLSRVEAARLRTARAKLKKDFNRVEAIAQNVKTEAQRRKDDTDRSYIPNMYHLTTIFQGWLIISICLNALTVFRKQRELIEEEERISQQIDLKTSSNGGTRQVSMQQQQLMLMEEDAMRAEMGISQVIIEETEASKNKKKVIQKSFFCLFWKSNS